MEDKLILLLALLGPVVGSVLGVTVKISPKILYGMMGFAGGSMIFISLIEMLPESIYYTGIVGSCFGVLIGGLILYSIDILLFNNNINFKNSCRDKNLLKVAIMSILAMFLHNLPEGFIMAVNLASENGQKAIGIALAIALHDIPEGYCTSAPYYYSTKKRGKSFLLSVSTIIPVIVGFFLGKNLYSIVNTYALGTIIAVASGMMLYISFKELIPMSITKGKAIFSIGCILAGGGVVLLI